MPFFHLLSIFITLTLAPVVSSYAITGILGGVDRTTGQRPFRQEFSTFRNSGPAFDLYILSLQQLQQQNQSALLSFYQVAGIHGHPYIAWDGVQGGYQAGYCTHGSILFPSWHRPYMLLYEQLLWNNAQQIAATYPAAQRSTYQVAATSFRVPYWDWAINATMPDPLNDPKITINTPRGNLSMANPLYNYTFHPHPSATDFPPTDMLAQYNSTLRYPNFTTGESQPSLANAQLQANAEAIQSLTYQLIADQSDYAPFSNTGYTDGRGDSYNSLENMHNAIHAFVGNGGHMSIIPYAAFDPIFWLHHANVDRLFAIWQAIYPNSYTTPEVNAAGTFTIAPGSNDTISSPLTPFHSDGYGNLYTSATARCTRSFGYTYPEVVDWGVNATQLSSNVRTALNNLYNPSGSISTRSVPHKHYKRHGNEPYPHPNATTSKSSTEEYQYFVNIRVDRSALHRPFFVHFFLGPVPTSPLTWGHAQTLIASHSILYYSPASLATTNNSATAYGQIPLNHALKRMNVPPTADPHIVEELLKSELSWRVQDFQDRSVDTVSVRGLKVFVVGREVLERAWGDRFPVHGGWVILRGATDGKVGGMREGERM